MRTMHNAVALLFLLRNPGCCVLRFRRQRLVRRPHLRKIPWTTARSACCRTIGQPTTPPHTRRSLPAGSFTLQPRIPSITRCSPRERFSKVWRDCGLRRRVEAYRLRCRPGACRSKRQGQIAVQCLRGARQRHRRRGCECILFPGTLRRRQRATSVDAAYDGRAFTDVEGILAGHQAQAFEEKVAAGHFEIWLRAVYNGFTASVVVHPCSSVAQW